MVTLEKTSPGSSEHDAPSISESTLPVPEIMDAAPSGDNIPKLDNPVDDRHEKQGDALLTEDAKGQEPRIDTERMKDEDDVGINNELKSESATNDEDGKENRHDDENERTLSEDEAEETLRLMRVNIASKKQRRSSDPIDDDDEIEQLASIQVEESKDTDPIVLAQIDLMKKSTPSSDLEIAYNAALYRKQVHLDRLTSEILKLKQFISKRKQTYKRKRKEDGAPTRALSAYNIFIQDRFAKLAKENENALKSEDKDATMKRVPPASLVAATGNAWKTLSNDEKQKYEER